MDFRYIIGNWKSNKSIFEAEAWLDDFHEELVKNRQDTNFRQTKIIICPPFPFLYPMLEKIDDLNMPVELGAQNVSPFPDGAYTGEVSAKMLRGLVQYCLVGHSERRELFEETDKDINKKVHQLKSGNIEPILCVSGSDTHISDGVTLVAYEPVWAIGSGKPATAEHAAKIGKQIKDSHPEVKIIYGGSVNAENVTSFISRPSISGVLPGGASLDPKNFFQLILNAQKDR